MVRFQTKNPNLGKFWWVLDEKMLLYFMAIWNILQTFMIFYDNWVHFVLICYIFSSCTKKNLATPVGKKTLWGTSAKLNITQLGSINLHKTVRIQHFATVQTPSKIKYVRSVCFITFFCILHTYCSMKNHSGSLNLAS
jgi:hypothetical protein